MKRWIQISIWVILALLASWMIFTAKGWAQDRQAYMVPDYNGGINVATDGTNLRPNEALEIINMTLDTIGVLSVRHGFSYLDSSAVKADSEIQVIYVYEPYPDTFRMIIATGGFIYIIPDLSDPGDVDWDTLRLSFSDDSLDATNGSATLETTGSGLTAKNPWWYLKTGGNNVTGDHIFIDEDDTATEYDIQKISQVEHDEMTVTPVYAGTTGVEMNYTVYKKIHGDPYITQFRNELYICDSDGFPIIYDDTSYSFIAALDSGVISTAVALNDTVTAYSTGKAKVKYNENKAYGNEDVVWQPSWADSTWDFQIHAQYYGGRGERTTFDWSSKIIDVDSTERVLTLENVYLKATPTTTWNDYEIKTIYYLCTLDSGLAVIDSNKNWDDFDLGDDYLKGQRAVFGSATSYGIFNNRTIGCNSDVAFTVPKTAANAGIVTDEVYYIFAGGLPYQFISLVTDDTRMEYPRFRQIAFYSNQLFGLGERKLVGNFSLASGIRDDHDIVWYSYPSIPRYSPSLDYFFSIDKNEKNTVFFPLRGNLNIGTENSIWEYSGIINESFLRRVVSDNGIPDYDNWAKATEEYGYFANRTGVYLFNGVRPQKISWRVDPIIQANYASRIVMVYQDYRLYVSFPDSNFTLLYNEPLDAWTKLDFGMTCAYAPPDTNIIYFGHSEFKGRVYYYPNDVYRDFVAIDDTNDISVTYESGWQSYAGYWLNKRLWDGFYPILSSDTVTIAGYVDFSATPADTNITDQNGRYVYRLFNDNNVTGEYFKIKMSGTVDSNFIFGGYRLEWSLAPDLRK